MDNEALRLRDVIKARLEELEHRLEGTSFLQEFSQLKLQVGQLSEATQELESRVIQLEQHKSLASWVVRQVVTIAVIVIIIWAIGLIR